MLPVALPERRQERADVGLGDLAEGDAAAMLEMPRVPQRGHGGRRPACWRPGPAPRPGGRGSRRGRPRVARSGVSSCHASGASAGRSAANPSAEAAYAARIPATAGNCGSSPPGTPNRVGQGNPRPPACRPPRAAGRSRSASGSADVAGEEDADALVGHPGRGEDVDQHVPGRRPGSPPPRRARGGRGCSGSPSTSRRPAGSSQSSRRPGGGTGGSAGPGPRRRGRPRPPRPDGRRRRG